MTVLPTPMLAMTPTKSQKVTRGDMKYLSAVQCETMSEKVQASGSNAAVFRRMLKMLRPYWGRMALGIFVLVLSTPAELFPAISWMYITDHIALGKNTAPWMTRWFSFGGLIQSRLALLVSATAWTFLVYLIG